MAVWVSVLCWCEIGSVSVWGSPMSERGSALPIISRAGVPRISRPALKVFVGRVLGCIKTKFSEKTCEKQRGKA